MSKTMTREQCKMFFLEYFKDRRPTAALAAEARTAMRMLEPDIVVSKVVAAMGFADAMVALEDANLPPDQETTKA